MLVETTQRVSEAEYLDLERPAVDRHEFRNGVVVEVPSSNHDHSMIEGSIGISLGEQLDRSDFELYMVAMRVKVPMVNLITYPDIVVCRNPQFLDAEQDVLLNPTFVCEVMSPRTIAYDLGAKAASYRQHDSLLEFLLVEQERPVAEHYVRRDEATWQVTRVAGLSAEIELHSIPCRITLADAFSKVERPLK